MQEFSADRAALANASRICADLDGGAKPQGSEGDKIGVQYYCSEYLKVFRVLRTMFVSGTFTIFDSDSAGSGENSFCEGDGGYGDLNSSTAVVVTNNSGEVLARTELGNGVGDGFYLCEFSFKMELTEGEDAYIVAIGDRGEFSYSWAEISAPGAIALSIG